MPELSYVHLDDGSPCTQRRVTRVTGVLTCLEHDRAVNWVDGLPWSNPEHDVLGDFQATVKRERERMFEKPAEAYVQDWFRGSYPDEPGYPGPVHTVDGVIREVYAKTIDQQMADLSKCSGCGAWWRPCFQTIGLGKPACCSECMHVNPFTTFVIKVAE